MPIRPSRRIEVIAERDQILAKGFMVKRFPLKKLLQSNTQNLDEPLRKSCGQGAPISLSSRLHRPSRGQQARSAVPLAKEISRVPGSKDPKTRAAEGSEETKKGAEEESGAFTGEAKGGIKST